MPVIHFNGAFKNKKTNNMVSGRTGEKCQVSGVYYCQSHPSNSIPLAKGNIFPPCSINNGHGTTWILKYKA